jgi:hypothetical protein
MPEKQNVKTKIYISTVWQQIYVTLINLLDLTVFAPLFLKIFKEVNALVFLIYNYTAWCQTVFSNYKLSQPNSTSTGVGA